MLPLIFLKLPSNFGHFMQIAPLTSVSQGELFFSLHPTRVVSERSSSTRLSLTKWWLTRAPPTAMTLACSPRQSLASTSLCLLHSSAAETTTICGTSWSRGTRGWYATLRYTSYCRTAFVYVDKRCSLAHHYCFESYQHRTAPFLALNQSFAYFPMQPIQVPPLQKGKTNKHSNLIWMTNTNAIEKSYIHLIFYSPWNWLNSLILLSLCFMFCVSCFILWVTQFLVSGCVFHLCTCSALMCHTCMSLSPL